MTPERQPAPLPMLEHQADTPERAAAKALLKQYGVPRNRAERRALAHTLRRKGRQ